jgi:hypothetical protein
MFFCRTAPSKIKKESKREPLETIKEKNRIRQILYRAIGKGKVKKRNSCEICHTSPSQCHHWDYSKPLEFIELCSRCHSFLHRQKRLKLKAV